MSDLIDLEAEKQKREILKAVKEGKRPLFVNHSNGTITGYGPPTNDFAERLQRIKAGLDRINALMAELKQNASDRR